MLYDRDRAGELTLALMYLTLHDDVRAWKGYSWDILDHLFAQGLIADPRNRSKSVILSAEGLARSRAMFEEYLASATPRLKAGGQVAETPDLPHRPKQPRGTLSELQQAEAARLLEPVCRLPPEPAVRAKLRIGYRVEASAIVLFESRPRFQRPEEWGEHPVAKFRYIRARHVWELFCMFRDLKWHKYQPLPEAESLGELVAEVRRDPTGIFWG